MKVKMQISNIHNAKTHLSDLIRRAEEGEDIVICKAGKPAVRLIKYEISPGQRIPGIWKGKIKMSEDFDELPENILNAFKGTSEG